MKCNSQFSYFKRIKIIFTCSGEVKNKGQRVINKWIRHLKYVLRVYLQHVFCPDGDKQNSRIIKDDKARLVTNNLGGWLVKPNVVLCKTACPTVAVCCGARRAGGRRADTRLLNVIFEERADLKLICLTLAV